MGWCAVWVVILGVFVCFYLGILMWLLWTCFVFILIVILILFELCGYFDLLACLDLLFWCFLVLILVISG